MQHAKCMTRPCKSSKCRMHWKLTREPTQRKILLPWLLTMCWNPNVAHIATHPMRYVLSLQQHLIHTVYTVVHATFVTPCTLPCMPHSSHRVHCLTCHIRHTVYTALHATFVTPCTLPCMPHSSHRVHCLTCHLSTLADVLPLFASSVKLIFACGVGL
jgi:hypothetical protein